VTTRKLQYTDDVQLYEYMDDVVGFVTPAGTVYFDPKEPELLRVVPIDPSHQVHTIRPTAFPSFGAAPGLSKVFMGLRLTQVQQPTGDRS
jgi:hypothetical protein